MSETLKAKIAAALANPGAPLMLTPAEAAELDAYMALVSYFDTMTTVPGGNA